MSTQAGHPDWLGYAQWMGPPLLSLNTTTITTVLTTYGPYHVEHFRSALLAVSGLSGSMEATLSTILPGAAAINMYVVRQRIWNGFQAAINLPTHGAQISLGLKSLEVGSITANIALHPNNLDPGYRSINQFHQLAIIQGVAIGPGATQVIHLPPYAGRAHYAFYSQAAGVDFEVRETDAAGNVISFLALAENVAANTPYMGDCVIGTGLHTVNIFNAGTGTASVDVAVYGDYAQQGDF